MATGLEYFGLLSYEPTNVYDYLVKVIENEKEYSVFMAKMRNYKTHAGYNKYYEQIAHSFFYYFECFQCNYKLYSINEKQIMSDIFKSTLLTLEEMKQNSLKKRNFWHDFTK